MSKSFDEMVEEVRTKYLSDSVKPDNSKDREALAKEIGQAVAEALAKAEAEKAAANDPENIRRENLERLYPSTHKN